MRDWVMHYVMSATACALVVGCVDSILRDEALWAAWAALWIPVVVRWADEHRREAEAGRHG